MVPFPIPPVNSVRAVFAVPDYGVSDKCQVRPDLMRPARLKPDFQFRRVPGFIIIDGAVTCNYRFCETGRAFALRIYGGQPSGGVFSDIGVERRGGRSGLTLYDASVFLNDLAG